MRPQVVIDFDNTVFDATSGAPRRLAFANPVEVLVAGSPDEVLGVLRGVERAAKSGLYAAGFVSYAAAPAFDSAYVVRSGGTLPVAWFGVYRAPLPEPAAPACSAFSLSGLCTDEPLSTSRAQYGRHIESIRRRIAAGEFYQVNYTVRMRAGFSGDPLALYNDLVTHGAGGYCAYVDIGRHQLASASPELFFRREGDSITVRPMKGTARRGRTTAEDLAQAAALAASQKDRAENLMIVDLLRNDLGKIADMGSVHVASLFEVERYPTVFQLTSTVAASLARGIELVDIFSALFPSGSVTGAPKISAMNGIAGLEGSPRGAYCGAIGYIAPNRDAIFNVAIRTAVIDGERGAVEYGVGGGITWDSTAEAEYAEMLSKTAILAHRREFSLLETLLLSDGAYSLRDRHIGRLMDSARYFDFEAEEQEVIRTLDQHASLWLDSTWLDSTRRVRLTLAPDGSLHIESRPLDVLTELPRTVALCKEPIDSSDAMYYHKTTYREPYDMRSRERPGCFDILLQNERGELTEFTRGNLIVELDGVRWTPSLYCGLLAGTFRAELLYRQEVQERVLSPTDLDYATGIWFVNSVRGWAPVTFVR